MLVVDVVGLVDPRLEAGELGLDQHGQPVEVLLELGGHQMIGVLVVRERVGVLLVLEHDVGVGVGDEDIARSLHPGGTGGSRRPPCDLSRGAKGEVLLNPGTHFPAERGW
jgi:hypothetical protein